MARSRTYVAVATAVVACALLAPSGASSASAGGPARCPSGGTPPPGSTIAGGLEVDGFCVLTHVTIDGGINVEPTPLAQLICCNQNLAILNGSTVDGRVDVGSASGFVTGIDPDTFNLTHDRSTIGGRLNFDAAGFLLADATVGGGITKNGAFDWSLVCGGDPGCFGTDLLCGSDVFGNVTIGDTNSEEVFLGDPKEPLFPNGDCAGNAIHGSVLLRDTNFSVAGAEPAEIEGNAITGTVKLDHSTVEVNENTIGGGLLCSNGSVVRPPVSPDLPGNSVHGTDSCG